MAKYAVTKYFGHFAQGWQLEAESEKDAWERAERDGKKIFQLVYREVKDKHSFGCVVNVDEEKAKEEPISDEQYKEWLLEAIEKGMVVTPLEYEAATGLPFYDI